MKKILDKKIILGLTIGLIFGSVSVYAAANYKSENVLYKKGEEEVVLTDALDELYSNFEKGDATETDIREGKTAIVKGKLVTGTLKTGVKKTLVWSGTIDPGSKSTTTLEYINLNNYYSNYKNITSSNIGIEQTDLAVEATGFGGCSTSWTYNSNTGLITLTLTARKGFPNCGKQSYKVYVYTAE